MGRGINLVHDPLRPRASVITGTGPPPPPGFTGVDLTRALQAPDRVVLLREVASGPLSAQFVGELTTERGGELVAVKVVLEHLARGAENLIRLRDHGRDLARLDHRHLVPTRDVIQVGDHLALVSDWVDGVDLLDWVEVLQETGTVLPGRVVCEILRATAVSLDAALNRVPRGRTAPLGLCHWDIKPSNVMVDRDGAVRVLDHGAGFTSLAGRQARIGALQKGLIKYISPDRREGKRGGPPSDVYALGIMGLELFRGGWLRRLRSHNPAHDRYLAEVVANLGDLGTPTSTDDAALRSVLLRMVAFDPEARPAAGEVAHAFRTLADRCAGPTLEAFAQMHALPWLEPAPQEADPELARVPTRFLEEWTPELERQLRAAESPRVILKHRRARAEWEETDNGWQQSTGEHVRPDDLWEDPPSDAGVLLGGSSLDEVPVLPDPALPEELEELKELEATAPTDPAGTPLPPRGDEVTLPRPAPLAATPHRRGPTALVTASVALALGLVVVLVVVAVIAAVVVAL